MFLLFIEGWEGGGYAVGEGRINSFSGLCPSFEFSLLYFRKQPYFHQVDNRPDYVQCQTMKHDEV
jgi:hypothetical protein